MRRRGAIAALLATGAVAWHAAPAAAQQTAVPLSCPATFSVLHDDGIGTLAVPAGSYALTVSDPARLSCAAASDRFRQFLEDWDGRLPAPWRLDPATATFSGGAGVGFRIAAVGTPSGGGGGQHPATGARCPGVFQVLHDDYIGALDVPAGSYTVTLLSVGPLSCAQAMNRLAAFLQRFNGRLPFPWVLETQTATFLKGVRGLASGSSRRSRHSPRRRRAAVRPIPADGYARAPSKCCTTIGSGGSACPPAGTASRSRPQAARAARPMPASWPPSCNGQAAACRAGGG